MKRYSEGEKGGSSEEKIKIIRGREREKRLGES
jgi:hypothetical protein